MSDTQNAASGCRGRRQIESCGLLPSPVRAGSGSAGLWPVATLSAHAALPGGDIRLGRRLVARSRSQAITSSMICGPFGLVVELVAETRVGPPLDVRAAAARTSEAGAGTRPSSRPCRTSVGIADPAALAHGPAACSASASAPNRAVVRSWRTRDRRRPSPPTAGSRDSVDGSMPFGIGERRRRPARGRARATSSSPAASSRGPAPSATARSGHRPVRQRQVAGHDEPAHRVAVQDDRVARRLRPHGDESLLEVVVELRPAVHVAAPAARSAVPAMVVRPDVQPGRRHLVADVLVAAGVLAQAVDEQDGRPRPVRPRRRRPRPRRPASGGRAGPCRRRRSRGSRSRAWRAAYATRAATTGRAGYHARMGVEDGWVEIGDRVFVRRYEFYDQNIGVDAGRRRGARHRHAQHLPQAREIQADLRELTPFPVTVVVDTHGHFDHAFGNRVFRPATIWGHERCVTFMERTGEARKPAIAPRRTGRSPPDLAEVVIDPPDRTFAESATIEVGGRPVELALPRPRPHRPRHRHHRPGRGRPVRRRPRRTGQRPVLRRRLSARLGRDVRRARRPRDRRHRPGPRRPRRPGLRGRRRRRRSRALVAPGPDGPRRRARSTTPLAAHPFPELPPEHAIPAFERALAQLRGELD